MRDFALKVLLVLVSLVTSYRMASAEYTHPPGLEPGAKYQLVFATLSTRDALSSDIQDYNDFVNAQAAIAVALGDYLPPGVAWHAIVSTDDVDAKDNAPSGLFPVYNTRGELVASSNIYSGSLLNPPGYDEFGHGRLASNSTVWTGSDTFGIGVPGSTLGDASGTSSVGSPHAPTSVWIHSPLLSDVVQTKNWSIYALSDPITVPVPEPSAVALLGIGGLAVAARRFFSRRKS